MMTELSQIEEIKWRDGFVSGSVYQGDSKHIEFLNHVYALHSQSNPLHADVWPSTVKFEAEIVAMTARMLGAPPNTAVESAISGVVTSGGTESILLAVKAYRDRAAAEFGISAPEVVAPATAHVALDKAADCFKINLIRVAPRPDFRADVEAMRAAITKNTIALVGSAPTFPHGVIDPIAELADLATEHQIGFHVDACLGGFILPWAERLGATIPAFDFRLPGVTSI
jgi:glutamate/tyrosine decarboxylase-like PLP-dependent enzyme